MTDTSAAAFAPLDRSTLSEQVRTQIEARIRSGELAPGAQVPSERALSEQFRVARTSVREAMQGLVTLGLVERRGNRSYVAEQLPEVVVAGDGRKAFVRQLFETRRVLEVPIMRLAATRASDDDRAGITTVASEFGEDLTLARFRELDRSFHARVAIACANPLLVEVYGKVMDRLFRSGDFASLLFATENNVGVTEIIRQSCRDHVEIAEAIAVGDPVSTAAASERHLVNVEERMLHELK